tara:strand:+ start:72 stop:635 length:564 start_codon:yes stop_codon:yes gene_type:complete
MKKLLAGWRYMWTCHWRWLSLFFIALSLILFFGFKMREEAERQERLNHLKSIAYEKSIFLSDAVGKGDIDAAKKHLDDGADVNLGVRTQKRPHSLRNNPLNVAIESRNNRRKKMVKLLLAHGADVNAENDRGWTPAESLYRTAIAMELLGASDEQKADNKEIASLLLQHGAETDSEFKHLFGKHGDQ